MAELKEGFLGGIANRVKDLLSRGKEAQAKRLAKGATSAGALTGYGKDMLQVFGYDSISAYLNIENDLLARFADYEEMDDTPELSQSLNLMADESTQNDYEKGVNIWVSSPDKTVEQILDRDLLNRRLRLPQEEAWEIQRTVLKYGNSYEEMLVDNTGVVGLNYLPPATVRRIEGPKGELFGFVQDYRGRYGYTPHDFQALIKRRFGTSGAGKGNKDWERPNRQKAIALEDWEVVHFRLRGKARRSIYGHCLAGDSRVWTATGVKFIRDLEAGDQVFTRHAGKLRTTQVLDQVCSGVKKTFRVKTAHREIVLTAEHPLLVDRGGKNNAWVPVEDISIGDRLVSATNMPEQAPPPPLGIELEATRDRYCLSLRGKDALLKRTRPVKYGLRSQGLSSIAKRAGFTRGSLQALMEGESSKSYKELEKLFECAELPFFRGAIEPAPSNLTLSDFVEPWFARLYGFMLGDGWTTQDKAVCIALGVNTQLNEQYISLLRETGLEVSVVKDSDGVPTQAIVYSEELVSCFYKLGWINGVRNKRVPEWIYLQSREMREEFVDGFFDADGWTTREGTYFHAELCNRDLLMDIKALIDGLGWTSGNVRERDRSDQTKIIKGKVTRSSKSYLLFFHKTSVLGGDFGSEVVKTIEEVGEQPVYDIEVSSSGHCFIADGLVVHNSVLEPARWIWKRLQLLEDAALIYRLQRAPERYAFYVDVGDLPPAEALHYVNRVKQQYKKRKFFDPCLTGDTLVNCLDGTPRSLKEMADKGGEHWVYSFDLAKGEVVPGKATNARKTGEKNPIFRVILDSGAVVRATADHPFLMRDGTYKDCAELKPNDRLMPLNLAQVRNGNDAGYVRVKQPSTGYHESVHQMVGRNLWEGAIKKDSVVHHIDGRKNNNDPGNLEVLSRRDHAYEHLESNLLKAREAYVNRVKTDQAFADEVAGRLAAWRSRDPERVKTMCAEAGNTAIGRRVTAAAPIQDEIENIIKLFIERDPLLTAEELVDRLNEDSEFLKLYQSLPTTQKKTWGYGTFHTWIRRRGYKGYKAFKKEVVGTCQSRQRKYNAKVKTKGNNHRVVAVQFDGYEDVYNMDVEKYNNFGLVSGIFVHNSTGKLNLRWEPLSQDDDFFIPVRKGQEGARIEVLGAPAWQHMEDIEYFRDKMFAGIGIPKSYLSQEGGVPRQILSNQDVTFARLILRVQREMQNGVSRICRIHLAALGIDPYQVPYDVHMTTPSSIYDLAQLEVMNARADLAARMQAFVSEHFILNKIFKLEDEDIQQIMKQRDDDAERLNKQQISGQVAQGQAMQQAGLAPSAEAMAAGAPSGGQASQSSESVDFLVKRLADGHTGVVPRQWGAQMLRDRYSSGKWEASIMQGDKQAERKAEKKLDQVLANDLALAKRFSRLDGLLQELKAAGRSNGVPK